MEERSGRGGGGVEEGSRRDPGGVQEESRRIRGLPERGQGVRGTERLSPQRYSESALFVNEALHTVGHPDPDPEPGPGTRTRRGIGSA